MIEEKLTIEFGDAENVQCCINTINTAINDFLSDATTVAHHGFELHGKDFHMEAHVSFSGNDDLISLNISDAYGVSAEYSFGATMKLVMTKNNNRVDIDCE